MIVTYLGTCNYESLEETVSTSGLASIQKFYQLYTSFSEISNNMDIFDSITQAEKENGVQINKIYNFSYMKIDAVAGTQIKINEKVFTIDDSASLEFRNAKITSAQMISEGMASITVVYNGIIYA
jgi:hypothetical protein